MSTPEPCLLAQRGLKRSTTSSTNFLTLDVLEGFPSRPAVPTFMALTPGLLR